MNEIKDTAMEEIWAIKEACWNEVAHLPADEAVAARLRAARESAIEMGFEGLFVSPPRRIPAKPTSKESRL